MIPTPDLDRNASPLGEPHKRLMVAVLQTVVDDCRGSVSPRTTGSSLHTRGVHRAIAYVTSTDRVWPFSFENLCEALSLDARRLRQQLKDEQRPMTAAIANPGSDAGAMRLTASRRARSVEAPLQPGDV